MSGATYRIEVRHDPHTPTEYEWDAYIIRVADDKEMGSVFGKTADEAVAAARRAILEYDRETHAPFTVYVDDEGQDADAPHSVKGMSGRVIEQTHVEAEAAANHPLVVRDLTSGELLDYNEEAL